MPEGVRPVLSLCDPLLLIDRAKCRHLTFEETYRGYFADLDLGLRVWEAGLRVVCTPGCVVTNRASRVLPYGSTLREGVFEADRRRFVARWLKSGRLGRLEREVWKDVPELCRLLELTEQVRRRAVGLAEVRQFPILEHALSAGGWGGNRSRPGSHPLGWLVDRLVDVGHLLPARSVIRAWERLRGCVHRGGYRGLVHALSRRLALLARAAGLIRDALPTSPNPTRDSRRGRD
jgi:hypothetical protein